MIAHLLTPTVLATAAVTSGAAPAALTPGRDVPATPSADQARQAAEAELSRRVYAQRPSPLQALAQWLYEHLNPRALVPVGPSWLSYAVVILALVLLAVALATVLRRLSRNHAPHPTSGPLFDDDRDTATLHAAAVAAAQRQRWDVAVLERFRAMVRHLTERGLVEDYPGLTANEAARATHDVLARVPAVSAAKQPATRTPAPGRADLDGAEVDLAGAVKRAGALFDRIRYGSATASQADEEWMRRLADQVEAITDQLPMASAGSGERQ